MQGYVTIAVWVGKGAWSCIGCMRSTLLIEESIRRYSVDQKGCARDAPWAGGDMQGCSADQERCVSVCRSAYIYM